MTRNFIRATVVAATQRERREEEEEEEEMDEEEEGKVKGVRILIVSDNASKGRERRERRKVVLTLPAMKTS